MANISKIHLPDESILGLRASGILIGRTDSTSTAKVQTATVPGLTELFDGMFMFIYNSTIASASGWTLNINGLGAKQVYNSQNTRTTTGFSKNTWFPLIYDGVNDRFVIGYLTDNNTTYTNVALGQGYGTCTTAAETTAKVVTLASYALTVNGIVAVKFDNDVPANATMNINSKGAKAIYHRGAAITDGVIKGGDTAYFIYNTYYHLLGVDRISDTNNMVTSSSSLTANQIVLGNGDKTIKGSDYTIIGPDALIWDDGETQIPTYEAVQSYLAELPEPMIFQGTLGTGGTITSLPAAAAGNTGYTYKVITNGTYQSIAAKAGDTFISNGSTWTLIPSGDEPSGTVTNIATGTGLTGGPITTTGTISIDTTTVAMKSDIPTTLDQIADGSTRTLSDFVLGSKSDSQVSYNNVAQIDGLYDLANDTLYVLPSSDIIGDTPEIVDYVLATTNQLPTESTVSGWGFTKNAGTITGVGNVTSGNVTVDSTPTANSTNLITSGGVKAAVDTKQDTLVSGTNIKTINNQSLLGSGNITINADTSTCELLANKVTSLSSSSTDTQYPSAKATYDAITAVATESLTTAEIDTIWNNAI